MNVITIMEKILKRAVLKNRSSKVDQLFFEFNVELNRIADQKKLAFANYPIAHTLWVEDCVDQLASMPRSMDHVRVITFNLFNAYVHLQAQTEKPEVSYQFPPPSLPARGTIVPVPNLTYPELQLARAHINESAWELYDVIGEPDIYPVFVDCECHNCLHYS